MLRALVTIITNFCVSAVYFILTLIKSTIKINSLSILNKIKMEKRTRHYHHRKVPVIKRFINKFQCSSQLILSSALFLHTHTLIKGSLLMLVWMNEHLRHLKRLLYCSINWMCVCLESDEKSFICVRFTLNYVPI